MEMVCNGVRIAYEVQGAGPAVTLIHGLTATHRVWEQHVVALSQKHQVLAYDLRGHGESAKPASNSYSFDDHVRDLLDLLDGLGIAQTALVGWSMGVSVAVAFAAAHPDRVSRLVLISGTPMLVARPDFPYAMPPEQQQALIAAAQQDFNGLMKSFMQMVLPEQHDPQLDDWLRGMSHMAGPEVYIAIMQQAAPYDLRPQIAQVKAPALVVAGALDSLCPVPAGRYLADHISRATFQLVDGVGHAGFLTRPEVVGPMLVQFLAG